MLQRKVPPVLPSNSTGPQNRPISTALVRDGEAESPSIQHRLWGAQTANRQTQVKSLNPVRDRETEFLLAKQNQRFGRDQRVEGAQRLVDRGASARRAPLDQAPGISRCLSRV